MQALKLQAKDGLRWIMAGWLLFRRQPFSFMALLFLFLLVLLCSSALIGFFAQAVGAVVPGVSVDLLSAIGSMLFAALTPALTVGFLQACRVAASGLQIHPMLLFAPFRAGRKTLGRLLSLGLIQMIVLVVILFVTYDRDATRPIAAPVSASASADARAPATADASPSDQPALSAADEEAMQMRILTITLAYLPVALVMWYAPMLVAWHDVPVGKSLFFSLVGVWRNGTAFVVYGIGWIVILMALSVVITIIGMIVGVVNIAAIVSAPLTMVLLTCMYCSMYQTYATVYVETPVEVVEA